MPDASNSGYEPFYPHECLCGHMDVQHHWTGRKYTYCTVHASIYPGTKCPCERWTP